MKIYRKWWFWLGLVVVIIALSSLGNDEQNNAPDNNQNNTIAQGTSSPVPAAQSPAATQTPAATATPSPVPTPASIKAGMYKVGADVPEGEYLLSAQMTAYFQLSKDSTGKLESIITNDNFEGTRYLTVASGQYIELRNCTMLPVENAPEQQPKDGKYLPGMYKVGRDIAPGEYKAVPEVAGKSSYIEVSSNSSGSLDSIVTNDNFTNQKYITISGGQYVKLVDCYLMK